MNNGFNLKLIVEYSAVFEEEPKDLNTYLTGISRSTLLNAATFFLGFSNRKSKFEEYKDFLGMFFCQENYQLANEIYFKLNALRQKHQAELVIISPQASLQIFEFCFDYLTDEDTQETAEAERNIFKAILLTNEQNTELQKVSSESTKDIQQELRFAALSLSQSFAYSDIVNYEISEVLTTQVIKSVYLFEFLESNPQTKTLLQEFLNYFNCNEWRDFLKQLLTLTFSVINAENEAHIDIHVENNEHFQRSCDFIEKLIVLDTEVINDYDFKKIRSKPFYKISDGIYRIIFGLFVIELIHKGVYFKLSEINNTLGQDEKVKGNFRSFYCDEFSEKFLLYKTLNSIYRNKYKELSGAEIKQLGTDAEPDYYIRKGNTLFLFESKDILINASIKSTYDFAKYEIEFQKKLYFENKNGKTDNKAVLQLTKNIERVLTKQFSFDTSYKEHSVYTYPIIILHDHQFNVAGLNVLVNHWFNIELEKLKVKGLFIDKVKPITIIDIDTFIFHQDIFRDRTIKLETVLDEYFKFVTFDSKRKYRDEEHAKEYVKRTVVPFSIFLSNYVAEKKVRRVPKTLMEKGIKLFN
jgi:hypothetical protein